MRNAKRRVQMANVLSLHERCSSELKQKDIKAGQDQKSVVGHLKEHGARAGVKHQRAKPVGPAGEVSWGGG